MQAGGDAADAWWSYEICFGGVELGGGVRQYHVQHIVDIVEVEKGPTEGPPIPPVHTERQVGV